MLKISKCLKQINVIRINRLQKYNIGEEIQERLQQQGEMNQLKNNELLNQKIQQMEKEQPFFDRLLFFDPDQMSQLPIFLQPIDPVIESAKNMIIQVQSVLHLPWWSVIGLTAICVRSTILPLLYVQMKRTMKLSQVIPVLRQLNQLQKKSDLKNKKQLMFKAGFQIIRQQQLKSLRLFLYNFVHIPMIVVMVWTMRRLLTIQEVKDTQFLWLNGLAACDPYYILPVTTIAIYYYNQQRYITKENQHTLISRFRNVLQIFFICWLPLLSNWPAGIQLYMLVNAIFSFLQSTIMVHPWFLQNVSPKMVLYNMMLSIVEYDKTKSQSIIDAIYTGEESFQERSMQEEQVVEDAQKKLKELEKEHKNIL